MYGDIECYIQSEQILRYCLVGVQFRDCVPYLILLVLIALSFTYQKFGHFVISYLSCYHKSSSPGLQGREGGWKRVHCLCGHGLCASSNAFLVHGHKPSCNMKPYYYNKQKSSYINQNHFRVTTSSSVQT